MSFTIRLPAKQAELTVGWNKTRVELLSLHPHLAASNRFQCLSLFFFFLVVFAQPEFIFSFKITIFSFLHFIYKTVEVNITVDPSCNTSYFTLLIKTMYGIAPFDPHSLECLFSAWLVIRNKL